MVDMTPKFNKTTGLDLQIIWPGGVAGMSGVV